MITEKEYEGVIRNEYRIQRHLYSLVDHDKLDFRFSPTQRSTLEVLQYLATIGSAYISGILQGNMSGFGQVTERQKAVTAANFLHKLDEEEKHVIELLKKFSTKDLDESVDLFKLGNPMRKAQWLMSVLQVLSAYRLQLFLQIKASTGRTDIGTADLWTGASMPKKD
jgi:hypothetical protein